MSYIYSIICKICRTIEREFKESLFFTIIHTIFLFFDRQWTNSYLFKFYPSNHRINLKSRILNEDLFNPMIIILLFSLFLIFGLKAASNSLVITIIIGLIAFTIGALYLPKFFLNNQNNNKRIIDFNPKDIYSVGFTLFLIGLIFFFINIG